MSLIENLAQIREMQGKPPLPNPHIIQGFEPGSPPVPDYVPRATEPVQDIADEFLDGDPPRNEPVSPLIPRFPRTPAGDALPPPTTSASYGILGPTLPVSDLLVAGNLGSWKGRAVTLSEQEEKAVRSVVLRAIRRELDADMAEAGAKRTRRAKTAPQAVSTQPRKPGRTRKVTA